MGREIKFRAWNDIDKSYIDWMTLCGMPKLITNIARGKEKHYQLEQFTGLKDKNGVEIYEGDVIKGFNRNYEVKFGECDASIQGSICEVPMLTYHVRGFPLNLLDEYEVLGNKHQNPELLNA